MHDPIAMELDEDGKWIVFRRTHREQGGDFARGLLELPPRYTLADVSAAARATGLVVARNDDFLLDATTGCNALANYIDRLFGYFEKPGKPAADLKRVIEQVRRRFEVEDDLPLWSYAWLDLIVRDDLADAARSEADPWAADELTLDVAKVRNRRLKEVLEVHRRMTTAGEKKLAKSGRTRTRKTKRQDRTG
jgi:hypothetical protein